LGKIEGVRLDLRWYFFVAGKQRLTLQWLKKETKIIAEKIGFMNARRYTVRTKTGILSSPGSKNPVLRSP